MRGNRQHTWVKASRSVGGGACVEFAILRMGRRVGIRDSKNPGEYFLFPPSAIASFVERIKRSQYDYLIDGRDMRR
jgi:Domain of unknown function (DUF397)